MKHLVLYSFFSIFIICAMTMLPQVQGLPISIQIAYIANQSLLYIQEMFAPLFNFLNNLFR